MTPPADLRPLLRRIAAERVVRVRADVAEKIAAAFEERERHATGLAGDLVLLASPAGLLGIETPETKPDAAYVRHFVDEPEAVAWVQRRLDQYERMWDG